jgi:DNA polymerase-3 subunit gamma/tau
LESKFTVTARKFRPMAFSGMVGQKHIVRALTNALVKNRIGHAYLFSGTRGVGKTTTARILAKSLNCKSGPTPEPCLKCGNCLEIAAGSSMDVMEIDGASNRGIDNIRELRERIMFAPANSRYKVYIIDEVHQISKDAFNALLKTLEEPPAFVVFIFATTEIGKVPETILSRCQSFEFKPLAAAEIGAQLNMIAGAEGIRAEPAAVELIARRARGSMRDAQSMFDQAEAYGAGAVTAEDVKISLGLVDNATMAALMDGVVGRDMPAILSAAVAVTSSGADPSGFLEDLAALARDVMGARILPGSLAGREDAAKLAEWAGQLDYDELQRIFNVITDTARNMRYAAQPHLALEMGLLRLGEKRGLINLDDAIDEVAAAQAVAEREMADAPVNFPIVPAPRSAAVESNLAAAPAEIQMAASGSSAEPDALLEAFKNARPILLGIMDHATVQVKGEVVVILVNNRMSLDQLEDPQIKATLDTVARRMVAPNARVVVELHGEKKNDEGPSGARKAEERDRSLKKQMVEAPIIHDAMDIFSLEVVEIKHIKGA